MELQIVSITGVNTDELQVCKWNAALSKGYSTMSPVRSPMMASIDDVINWFNNNPQHKQAFVKDGCVCVYVHIIANQDTCLDGYCAVRGEIVSTDEAYAWDYKDGKWIPWS